MASSRESSASEGEILDSQHLKAKNVDHNNDSPVNDSDRVFGLDGTSDDYGRRKYRRLSRSPSPYRHKRTRSPSPYRHKRVSDRSRSPSPYRHRPQEDRDRDRNGGDYRSHHKRRSSPPRGGRAEKRQHTDRGRFDRHQRPRADDARAAPSLSDFTKERQKSIEPLSYADLGNPSAVPDFRDSASTSRHIQKSARDSVASRELPRASSRATEAVTSGVQEQGVQESHSADVEMKNAPEVDFEPVVVEDKIPTKESREEKKRRWAAMRAAAEQKAQENLLQKVLLNNASEATTPNGASPAPYTDSPSSPFASPHDGELNSVPASPDVMVIDKEGGFSEANSPAADSPSAADYDPMQDMLDDRDRAAKKNQAQELSSNAYSETDPKVLSTLPAQKVAPVKKQKEFDMFASDDEDEDEEVTAEDQADAKGTVLDEKLLDNWDDHDGYYKIISNELINNKRYRVVRPLGRGVFANVVQAVDVNLPPTDSSHVVAIKMIRRNDLMKKASIKEMDFLRRANEEDPQDKKNVVRLLGSFDHKGHLCIVFEHMSKNLRDLLKEETNGHGLSLSAVRVYAKQMFSGLLHLQNCHIIHFDLKPDNILVSADKKTVKLADFGTAVDSRDPFEHGEYQVSRFYRAPEIILGMDMSYPVDMWAVGCTVYELWTGKILFTGRSNNQMVKAFMDCLGWPSEKLLKKGTVDKVLAHFDFVSSLKFISREVDQQNKASVRVIGQQKKINRDLKTRIHDAAKGIASGHPTTYELNDLTDLLNSCLHWNVDKRATPKDALGHKFFGSKSLAPKSAVVKPPIVKRGTPVARR